MTAKNTLSKGQILSIAGGIISIIGVFLPWYSASMTASAISFASAISVNGLGWKNGEGLLLGMISGDVNWQFQGIGVIAFGIASIIVAIVLTEKIQSMAMLASGLLIMGGSVVNLQSIGSLSGKILGATMQSGAGYGLYAVLLGGAVAAAGGLIAWRDFHQTSV